MGDVQKLSLDALARQELKRAANTESGRSAETIVGGHAKALRQTVIAMMKGVVQNEHESPGEATVQVLHGRVRLGRRFVLGGPAGTVLIVPEHATRSRHWKTRPSCSPWRSRADVSSRRDPESLGAPGRNRTSDTRFRKPLLFSTELRGRPVQGIDGQRSLSGGARAAPVSVCRMGLMSTEERRSTTALARRDHRLDTGTPALPPARLMIRRVHRIDTYAANRPSLISTRGRRSGSCACRG